MSLSNIAYPNSNQIPLECGDLHIDGSLYNNSGVVVNSLNVAVGEVSGSIAVSIGPFTSGTPIPSATGNTAYSVAKNPLNGFTSVNTNVAQNLFTIKYAGTYKIDYDLDFILSAAGTSQLISTYIYANINGQITAPITGSISSVTCAAVDEVYHLSGTAIQTFAVGDIINEIAVSATISTSLTVQNANVVAQLVA